MTLENKWTALKSIITSMLDITPKRRPTCDVILNENWKIFKEEIEKFKLNETNIFKNVQDNSFKTYFDSRLILLNKSIETDSGSNKRFKPNL